jgi:Uma2 family endonuclease
VAVAEFRLCWRNAKIGPKYGETKVNIALRRPRMSIEEFLAWENCQEKRWEFDGFEPRAMVGGSSRHNRIVGALEFALRQRLADRCIVYRETMRLRLEHTARYPDLMVVCTPVADDAQEVADPVVVIEVLSPTTARTDRIEKNREYEAAPSIRRYILLEQDTIAAEVYVREDRRWVRSTVTGEGILVMPEISVELPLAEAYAGLELGTEPN